MSGAIRVSQVENSPLWAISCHGFSPKLIEHAKAVPGMRFAKNEAGTPANAWVGYVDAVDATVARLEHVGLTVFGVSDLPDACDWRGETPRPFSTAGLREYQIEGVRFLIARSASGALLADGMRLGKSAQATFAARAFKQRTLVLCPPHVVGVWSRDKNAPEGPGEIAKWWPSAWQGRGVDAPIGVIVLEGVKPAKASAVLQRLGGKTRTTEAEAKEVAAARFEIAVFADKLRHANVIVCHYDIAYAWVDVLRLWGLEGFTLVCDEIHVLAGYQSRRAEAIKMLRASSERMIGLTGTPVTNKPRQTHNVLEIISPRRFGYFFSPEREGVYSKVFCDAKQKTVGSGPEQKVVWDFDGRSNLDVPDGQKALTPEETLAQRLKHMMLRRLKKDVDPELPAKQRKIIDVTVPTKTVIGVSESMLGKGGKELRQALDLAADGKLKSVIAVLEGHIAEGEKILVGCYRRAFTEVVAQDLKKRVGSDAIVRFVHGGMSQTERDKAIHAVRRHDGPGALVGTFDTTSTGIDLSFASVGVACELVWEPHELAQWEERLYKFGENSKSLIEYIIARGTGDELILRGVISKLETAESVVGTTGDHMREDLAAQKGDPMKRLYEALLQMRRGDGSASGTEKTDKKSGAKVTKTTRVRKL